MNFDKTVEEIVNMALHIGILVKVQNIDAQKWYHVIFVS